MTDRKWQKFGSDYVPIQRRMERFGFVKCASKERIRDTLAHLGKRPGGTINFLTEAVKVLKHDGVPRLEMFCPKYLGTVDNAYFRIAGLYILTALAARSLTPGCEASIMPILIGKQGTGKSRAVKALSILPDRFRTISLRDRDVESIRKIKGCCIVEVSELDGLSKREISSSKEFISATYDMLRPLYQDRVEKHPRHFLLVGTTNIKECIPEDTTGYRRFMPLLCGKIDVEAIERDRDQLWAEGATLVERLPQILMEAERLAREVHGGFVEDNFYETKLVEYLELEHIKNAEYLTIVDILWDCFQIGLSNSSSFNFNKAGKNVAHVLRRCGYDNRLKWVGKTAIRVWTKCNTD